MMTALSIVILLIAHFWLAYETDWFRVRLPAYYSPHSAGLFPRFTTPHLIRTLILLGAILLILILLSPSFFQYFFFRMPGQSPDFDCDDSVLLMLDRFSRFGVTATPVLGNLKTTGEAYLESDHVWLLVEVGRLLIPFDWGSQRLNSQYYEGFSLTRSQLLFFVEQDRESQPNQVAAYTRTDEVQFRNIRDHTDDSFPDLTAP